MDIDKVCKRIAKEINTSPELVKEIVMHQFKFVVNVMTDEDDVTDVLINKLFRFSLKKRFKEDKQRNYSPYEKDSKH